MSHNEETDMSDLYNQLSSVESSVVGMANTLEEKLDKVIELLGKVLEKMDVLHEATLIS